MNHWILFCLLGAQAGNGAILLADIGHQGLYAIVDNPTTEGPKYPTS